MQVVDITQIVPGSKVEFDLLCRADDRPVDLSVFTSAKLIFKNCAGVETEIVLAVPGLDPSAGVIPVALTALQTAGADAWWASADMELVEGADVRVIVLENRFEILNRVAP
jgi:hypothetical protein